MKKDHRPIRIAYVIDSLALRGTQRALIHLVQGLSQRNYQQKIYSLNNVVNSDNKKALLECGADVKVIGKLQLLTSIGLIRIVCDWLIWKPDIVFTMLFYSDVIGRIIAKITSVPIIISSIRAKNIYKNELQRDDFKKVWDYLDIKDGHPEQGSRWWRFLQLKKFNKIEKKTIIFDLKK